MHSTMPVRDCQGFQKPQGSGVRVQEGRVGVKILYPHETFTLARGQGVCQARVLQHRKKRPRVNFFAKANSSGLTNLSNQEHF